MKFKPGTLVKLVAGYEKYLAWIFIEDVPDYSEYWFDKSHIGLMLGNDYDNHHVRILVEEQIISIDPKALEKYQFKAATHYDIINI